MNVTTIKLSRETKLRIDKLKIHKRESYEELLQRLLNLLNLVRFNPERAQSRLLLIDRQKRKAKPNKSNQNNTQIQSNRVLNIFI